MRHLILLVIFFAFAVPLHAAGQSDAQLTKLMVGAWRSPRHDYIYFVDGTWWMGNVQPGIAHGRWRIKNHHLEQSITYGEDKGPPPTEDHGLIQKLTRRDILFGGVYRMKRINMRQVDEY